MQHFVTLVVNGRLLLENEKIGATCSTLNEFQCLGCNNTYINTISRNIMDYLSWKIFFIGKRSKNRRKIPNLNQSRYKIIYIDSCATVATVKRSELVADLRERSNIVQNNIDIKTPVRTCGLVANSRMNRFEGAPR